MNGYNGVDTCTTECNQQQLAWLEADLQSVNRTRTPWVVAMSHYPLYHAEAMTNREDAVLRESFSNGAVQSTKGPALLLRVASATLPSTRYAYPSGGRGSRKVHSACEQDTKLTGSVSLPKLPLVPGASSHSYSS